MELESYTMGEVFNHLVFGVAIDKGVSKAKAKELVLNALTFNIVVAAINEQVDYLLGCEEEAEA